MDMNIITDRTPPSTSRLYQPRENQEPSRPAHDEALPGKMLLIIKWNLASPTIMGPSDGDMGASGDGVRDDESKSIMHTPIMHAYTHSAVDSLRLYAMTCHGRVETSMTLSQQWHLRDLHPPPPHPSLQPSQPPSLLAGCARIP